MKPPTPADGSSAGISTGVTDTCKHRFTPVFTGFGESYKSVFQSIKHGFSGVFPKLSFCILTTCVYTHISIEELREAPSPMELLKDPEAKDETEADDEADTQQQTPPESDEEAA